MILRIKELLKDAGHTLEELSEAIDMNPGQVSRFVNGRRRTNTEFLEKTADFLGLAVSDLFQARELNVVGFIGAGAEFHPIDDHAKGAGMDTVDAPPGCPPDAVAVQIKGDSMVPAYFDGDILVYAERRPDIDEFFNRRCVVGLADGRILVKTVRRGSAPGLYTLTSFNSGPIDDVVIDWAARIIAVMPR
ncbi:MAG: helix-turn-helix domain-containing protein [Acidimicrobiales bacterium]|nr:helix-turn-helix domain-containing protein [Hyphomonadaceae bacterium]RZV41285.1 MAG: helix-turn-helix domain-containing protein [Acidimicrobiales bacterium]